MKEQLTNLWATIKDKLTQAIQEQAESPTTVRIREWYESLAPSAQKAVKIGVLLLGLIIVFAYPISNYLDSSSATDQFVEKRQTIKDLLKIARDLQNAPQIPPTPSSSGLHDTLLQATRGSGIKDEQIKQTTDVSTPRGKIKETGLEVSVEKISLKQALDLSYGLETAGSATKLTILELKAEQADPHYYDAHLKLVGYSTEAAAAGSLFPPGADKPKGTSGSLAPAPKTQTASAAPPPPPPRPNKPMTDDFGPGAPPPPRPFGAPIGAPVGGGESR